MEIDFEQEYLRELYEDGKTSDKKHRFQPQVIKQYIKTVNVLRSVPDIESLYRFNSLHYEKKKGNLKYIEAVYVNKQFRLEFSSRVEGEEPNILIICSLSELSNHYQR